MTNNWLRGVILVLATAGAGIWLWQTPGDPVQVLAALALAVTAVLAAFWQSRVQSARRVRRVLDFYVERTLARERSRRSTKVAGAKVPPGKPLPARVA
jgi:hypothetical protein